MMDLKERYMERADELSWDRYEMDFYDLTKEQQESIWLQAEEDVVDSVYDHADNLRKAQKENII